MTTIIDQMERKKAIGSHFEPCRIAVEVDFAVLYECNHGYCETGFFHSCIYPAREVGKDGRVGLFVSSSWVPQNGYNDTGTDERFIPFDAIEDFVED